MVPDLIVFCCCCFAITLIVLTSNLSELSVKTGTPSKNDGDGYEDVT